MKRFPWIRSPELQISVCKTQLITWGKTVYFVKPKAWKQVRHWCMGTHNEWSFRYICKSSCTWSTLGPIKKYNTSKPLTKQYDRIHTAWKNRRLARVIKLDKTIRLVKVKLLINSSMIVLVQALVLEYFLPYTRAIIVHWDGIFCFLPP